MIKDVVSKNGIFLLNPKLLGEAVRLIEDHHLGWWWSLSQRKNRILLSLGPGRNGPCDKDLKLALTTEGDSGFHYSLYFCHHDQEKDFLIWLNTVFLSIAPKRSAAVFLTGGECDNLPAKGDWYRKQSPSDIDHLNRQYEVLLTSMKVWEDAGHLLTEVYIGACDITADCSLRGKRKDGSDFDISVDIGDRDKNIGHSVYWAVIELNDDILTFTDS